jgi:hypothetical protein
MKHEKTNGSKKYFIDTNNYIHPKKQETIYKGFMGLQSKVNLEQFDEAINLVDTSMEFMNHSAAVRKSKSINLHRTGSKDGSEPANNNQ